MAPRQWLSQDQTKVELGKAKRPCLSPSSVYTVTAGGNHKGGWGSVVCCKIPVDTRLHSYENARPSASLDTRLISQPLIVASNQPGNTAKFSRSSKI